MRKLIGRKWRLLAVAMLAAVMAGCADGELKFGGIEPDISPPKPIILYFEAEPSELKAGETTTLSWEVIGADSVEITAISTGEPVNFHVQTEELASSAATPALSATTDFVLTATKKLVVTEETESPPAEGEMAAGSRVSYDFKAEEAAPEEEEAPPPQADPTVTSVSQTITVTVVQAGQIDVSITADDDDNRVPAGARTVIRWSVSPTDGVSVLVEADTDEVVAGTDQCDGDMDSIMMAGQVGNYPPVGCAVVAPVEKTTYTAKATDDKGGEGSASVTLNIEDASVEAEVFVDGKKNVGVPGFPAEVTVSWAATPAEASVTVTASPAASCDIDLSEANSVGSTVCTVTAETEFAIYAELGEKHDSDNANVRLAAGGVAALVIADQWAFQGETVSLDIELSQASNPEVIEKLLVDGAELSADQLAQLKSEYRIMVPNVRVTSQSVPVTLVYGGGNEITYPAVRVVALSFKAVDHDVVAVSSVAYDDAIEHRYTGVMLDGFNAGCDDPEVEGCRHGMARIYVDGGSKQFDFASAVRKGLEDVLTDAFFEDDVKTFPVGAVAIRDGNREEIYAGVTGAVMRSKDRGETWENIMITRRRAHSSYSGDPDHDTCGRGKKQTGREAQFNGDFISLNQICDIIAQQDGRVIVATDFGVQVEKNIDDDKLIWIGTPAEGNTGPEIGALTFGHVVHDLEIVGDKVFAAADHGVFMSEDGGIHWVEFGAIKPAYALGFEAKSQTLYAGTEDGLYTSPVDQANWSMSALSKPVVSIAVDQYSAVGETAVLATSVTGSGDDELGALQVSRDGGASWTELVPVDMENGGVMSKVALVAKPSAASERVTYGVAIGTSAGDELFSKFEVAATVDQQLPPEEKPEEDEPENQDLPDDTGSGDGDGTVSE